MFRKVLLLLTLAAVLTGCEEATNVSRSSTNLSVTSLAAPEISGTAYPGVNYVTWKPVRNATEYRLYKDNRFV